MLNFTRSKNISVGLGLAFLCATCAFGQQQPDQRRKTNQQGRNELGTEQPGDFAQENLSRVAAAASQIRAVLVNDEGLMVELKRWVAKEATDNGQVVEDANLTDQAIFERLEQDIAFRSVATRLLQRYGYLLPTPNPNSDFAKENDLVLKERARRLVQIEAQEDSEALRPQRNGGGPERTASCDPRRDEDCPQQPAGNTQQKTRTRGGTTSPEMNPQTVPEQQPVGNPSRILQASGSVAEPLEGFDGVVPSPNLAMPSGSDRRDTNSLTNSQIPGQGAIDGMAS